MNRLESLRSMAHSQNLRWLVVTGLFLMMVSLPLSAQFTGGTVQVDPTVGAQTVTKYIVDGVLYCVAGVAFIFFCWGIVQLLRRPLEGIMEVAVGLTVMYLIGHSLSWNVGVDWRDDGLMNMRHHISVNDALNKSTRKAGRRLCMNGRRGLMQMLQMGSPANWKHLRKCCGSALLDLG